MNDLMNTITKKLEYFNYLEIIRNDFNLELFIYSPKIVLVRRDQWDNEESTVEYNGISLNECLEVINTYIKNFDVKDQWSY